MKYEVVLFDIDDTLLTMENDGTWEKMFNSLLLDLGVAPSPNDYDIFIKNNHRLWTEAEESRIEGKDVFNNRFDLPFLKDCGVSSSDIDNKFQDMQKKEVTPTLGAVECCKQLSQYAKLYAASNGKQRTQDTRIKNSVLATYISEVFTSDKVNALKPEVKFFDNILKAIQFTDKDRILMVGDTYSEDVVGASNYGIDSCWLNAKNSSTPQHKLFTYEVKNLGELPALII